ncbi:MAG TPA: Ig-like domain-containing protein, partial [Smithella sp.]|nr:Ig-like domain-containing protein [Smithella sp.]
MRKLNKHGFLSLLNLIIIFAILSLISACGGGGGDDVTDLTSIHSITLEADATTLNAGQRTTVTAIVTDGTGAVVTGEEVTFSIPTNPSGATIAAVSGTTDANGIATATYTAGSNLPTTTVDDIIQASTSNATKSLIITRAAGDGSTTPTAGLSLTAASTSLKAGGETFLTATLTDETGNPVSGQAVVFSISTNNSGATITTMSGTTDYNGQATARYTAGNLFSTVPLQDTVQATSGTYTRSVIITRTAAAAGSVIYIEADETTLAAGESTQITATVKDDTGALVTGQAVTFGYVTAPPSGAGNLQVVGTGTTDADGQATAIYTAGSANATLKVQDIIRVSIPASAKAVIITRTAAAGSSETAYNLSITASPTSLKIGKNSIITATLTSGSGAAANGKTIAFAFVGTAASGAANPVVLNGGVTDANG